MSLHRRRRSGITERKRRNKQTKKECARPGALEFVCKCTPFFFLCYFSHRFMITHPQLFWLFLLFCSYIKLKRACYKTRSKVTDAAMTTSRHFSKGNTVL